MIPYRLKKKKKIGYDMIPYRLFLKQKKIDSGLELENQSSFILIAFKKSVKDIIKKLTFCVVWKKETHMY